MKKIINYIFLLTLLLISFACEKIDDITWNSLLTKFGDSKWQIVGMKMNGTEINQRQVFETIVITFFKDGQKYQITDTKKTIINTKIYGEGSFPNYYSYSLAGVWNAENKRITFDGRKNDDYPISILGELNQLINANPIKVTLEWDVPESIDKLEPTFQMTLQLIQ